jgi:hypothetical protein
MDTLKTIIALLPFSLPIIPFLFVFAVVVAYSGSKYHRRGAAAAAVSIYLLYVLVIASIAPMWLEWWKHLLTEFFLVGIPLFIVLVPMFAVRNSEWMRGRLVAGLIGVAVATFIFPYFALIVSCDFLGDCL